MNTYQREDAKARHVFLLKLKNKSKKIQETLNRLGELENLKQIDMTIEHGK